MFNKLKIVVIITLAAIPMLIAVICILAWAMCICIYNCFLDCFDRYVEYLEYTVKPEFVKLFAFIKADWDSK